MSLDKANKCSLKNNDNTENKAAKDIVIKTSLSNAFNMIYKLQHFQKAEFLLRDSHLSTPLNVKKQSFKIAHVFEHRFFKVNAWSRVVCKGFQSNVFELSSS